LLPKDPEDVTATEAKRKRRTKVENVKGAEKKEPKEMSPLL
jgi:hypothetical protein